jgi:hypothetical protein
MILFLIQAATSTGDSAVEWLAKNLTGAVLAALIIVGFMTGRIVPGTTHQRVLQERNRAIDQVYRMAEVAQRALDAGERK